jgi:hypothetical protein
MVASCTGLYCSCPRSVALEIPIRDFAPDITDRHDLDVIVYGSTGVDPSRLDVLLDGSPGVQSDSAAPLGGYRTFRWEPFPTSPTVLEIVYTDGPPDVADVGLEFHDAACEREHPREVEGQ